ncbi:MAG: hypothetical protein KME31_37060 [Tolypothrix carrinoi HA7290-LM1]|nr:hypothetical protein [Tolypothrix carrinoi HA7290-LM1]
MGETTAGAVACGTRPPHCLPLALASPFGRRPRWLTTNYYHFQLTLREY